MKVRFSENTVRLRLSEHDLTQIETEKTVDLSTVFSPYDRLSFTLELWFVETPKISFQENKMRICIHHDTFLSWKNSSEEGLYFTEKISDSLQLNVSVEKDFPCKH